VDAPIDASDLPKVAHVVRCCRVSGLKLTGVDPHPYLAEAPAPNIRVGSLYLTIVPEDAAPYSSTNSTRGTSD
jgi:hypothetical protein